MNHHNKHQHDNELASASDTPPNVPKARSDQTPSVAVNHTEQSTSSGSSNYSRENAAMPKIFPLQRAAASSSTSTAETPSSSASVSALSERSIAQKNRCNTRCEPCKKNHIKCDGGYPCNQCNMRSYRLCSYQSKRARSSDSEDEKSAKRARVDEVSHGDGVSSNNQSTIRTPERNCGMKQVIQELIDKLNSKLQLLMDQLASSRKHVALEQESKCRMQSLCEILQRSVSSSDKTITKVDEDITNLLKEIEEIKQEIENLTKLNTQQ
jgi:hypothetical protein